jgi:hypothetical protein
MFYDPLALDLMRVNQADLRRRAVRATRLAGSHVGSSHPVAPAGSTWTLLPRLAHRRRAAANGICLDC